MNNIKLIVGLSNPGSKYALTRHNAGAWYVKSLAKHYDELLKENNKFFAYTTMINIANNHIHLVIPTTYMNLSGKSILTLANFYHIKTTEILVAHDELNLNPGTARIKLAGSNNGHNGLNDIQNKLGNNPNFYRLRIGIGHPGDKNKIIKFVLNEPTKTEKKLIDNTINEAINCTLILISEGINKAINRLHSFKAIN